MSLDAWTITKCGGGCPRGTSIRHDLTDGGR